MGMTVIGLHKRFSPAAAKAAATAPVPQASVSCSTPFHKCGSQVKQGCRLHFGEMYIVHICAFRRKAGWEAYFGAYVSNGGGTSPSKKSTASGTPVSKKLSVNVEASTLQLNGLNS